MSNDANRNPGWRPWQFSLRTLIVVMLCVASFFGGWQANEWKRRRELEANRKLNPFLDMIMDVTLEPIPELEDEGPLLSLLSRTYWDRITSEK